MPNQEPTAVRIARRFEAPPEKVWRAWTDPAVVRQWFGSDPKGQVASAILDVRPGGTFEVSFSDSDRTAHTCSGIYTEVQVGTALAFTWRWKSEPQHESFVTVSLAADRSGTQMHFAHSRLGPASLHDYANGWDRTFAKLERALEALP